MRRFFEAAGTSEWLVPGVGWALVLSAFDVFMFARDGFARSAMDLVAVAGIDTLTLLCLALAFDLSQHLRTTISATTRGFAWALLWTALVTLAWTTATTLVTNVRALSGLGNAWLITVVNAVAILVAFYSLRARIAPNVWFDLVARASLVMVVVWLQTRARWGLRESRHALASALLVALAASSGIRFAERLQNHLELKRPRAWWYLPALASMLGVVAFSGAAVAQRAYLRGLIAGRIIYAVHLPAVWHLRLPYSAVRRFSAEAEAISKEQTGVSSSRAVDVLAPGKSEELVLVLTVDALRHDSFERALRQPNSPLRKYAEQSCYVGGAYSPSSDTASTFRALVGVSNGTSSNWLKTLAASGVRTTLVMNRFVVDHLAARMAPPLTASFQEAIVPPRKLPSELEGADITKLTLGAVDASSPRQLIWTHYFDVHEWHGDRLPRDEAYAARVQTTMGSVAALLDALAHDRRRLTVALFSDHGEGLGHFSTETHGEYLYEPLVRVPYLLWTSDGNCDFADQSALSTRARCTIEVPAMIFQRFGMLGPGAPNRTTNDTIFMAAGLQTALIAWPHKLIVSPWFAELYDLQRDPAESHNLADESTDLVSALSARIAHEGAVTP